jgi:hypothetical protein
MYLSLKISTQHVNANFHRFGELLSLLFFSQLTNLKIIFDKNMIIDKISTMESLEKLNEKYDLFIFNFKGRKSKFNYNCQEKWDGFSIDEIKNIYQKIRLLSRRYNIILFHNVFRISLQTMYKLNRKIYDTFIKDVYKIFFNTDDFDIINKFMIHIRTGDLLFRNINDGLNISYYSKVIAWAKENYNIPIKIILEDLETSRYGEDNKNNKNIEFIEYFKNLPNEDKDIEISIGNAENDLIKDFIELMKYKYFFISGSNFSLYSIVLNKGEIILDKLVRDLRVNIFKNIEYADNFKLINLS